MDDNGGFDDEGPAGIRGVEVGGGDGGMDGAANGMVGCEGLGMEGRVNGSLFPAFGPELGMRTELVAWATSVVPGGRLPLLLTAGSDDCGAAVVAEEPVLS